MYCKALWKISQQLWVLVSGCLFTVHTHSHVFVGGGKVLFSEFLVAQHWTVTQSSLETKSGCCKHKVQGPIFKNNQKLKVEPSFFQISSTLFKTAIGLKWDISSF